MNSQSSPSPPGHRFTGVHVFGERAVFVRGVLRELDEKQVRHAFVLRLIDDQWSRYYIHNNVTSQCTTEEPARKTLSLCFDGAVHVEQQAGAPVFEHVDPGEDGPDSRRWMWEIRPIGASVYAVGMGRRVYRRTAPGSWLAHNRGAEMRAQDEIDSGFRSIDGCSENNILAVGLHGEIWRSDGLSWSQLDSPTNVRLERVRFVNPGLAYVCGGAGVILRGDGAQWSVVQQTVTDETFTDLAVFRGRVFLATSQSLYELDAANELLPVDIPGPRKVQTNYLAASDRLLWSAGGTDIATFDGAQWQFPPHPLSGKS